MSAASTSVKDRSSADAGLSVDERIQALRESGSVDLIDNGTAPNAWVQWVQWGQGG